MDRTRSAFFMPGIIAPERRWRELKISNMQGHAEVSTLAYAPKPAYVPTYRYDGSGRFFLRLGDECADAMLNLMGRK